MVVLSLVPVTAQGQLPWRPALTVAPWFPGRGSWVGVAALLLGDMRLRPVHSLNVLPQGAGVGVALGAAWDLTHVRFL